VIKITSGLVGKSYYTWAESLGIATRNSGITTPHQKARHPSQPQFRGVIPPRYPPLRTVPSQPLNLRLDSSLGQNTKIAIAPYRSVRLFSPFGHIFRYILARWGNPSRATAPMSPASGDVDISLHSSLFHAWYVNSYHSRLCSHVLYTI